MVWRISALVGILFACGQYGVAAQPTWPASTDELEDIIFLNTGYRARGFADPVTPCSTGVAPGRITAAEFIRTAFHDMASGNTYTGIGGLDGSIIFETGLAENVGAGFVTTLSLYAPFFSSRTSISDIIAAGVYTATRSCGGPIIPIRGGHKDATEAGPSGAIPLPQNALGTFKNQFLRVGYNATEMISFVACGHTLGGVHSPNFPDIVPPGTAPDDFAVFDTTSSTFDSRLPIEFVAGTTIDPLVRSNTKKNSDTVVFTSDTNNATIKSMQDPTTFANICKDMFQRMIEVVPAGVTLSDPVTAYEVKPYDIQLTLQDGASTIAFTGDVRIRTTQRSVAEVQLNYKDHTGATVANPISTIYKGDAKGFDSTFSFFSFDATLPAQDSISSFNVVVIVSGGTSEVFTNNGNGFKVDDSILYQAPQSCLDGSGKLTVVAAVRNTSSSSPSLSVVVKNPRSSVIIPALSTATAAMATQSAVGAYQLYSASYQFSGSQAQSAVFGVVAGSSSDNDKNTSWLPTACSPLSSSTPSSTPPTSSYSFQGCYTDAGGSRALSGAASYDDAMTVEKCAAACTQFQLFGLEYGRECYCGNTLDASSVIAGLSDCSMACSGNSNQRCGAASRLSTYKNLNYVAPVNTNITGYSYIGCYSEGTATRALSDGSTTSDAMTVKSCSTFCSGAAYFGLEYGRECYCGSKLQDGSTLQAATDCSMLCSGNTTEYCGASYRLNVYQKTAVQDSSASASTSTTAESSTATPLSSSTVSSSSSRVESTTSISTPSSPTSSSSTSTSSLPTPTLSNYTYLGCAPDTPTSRLLTSQSTTSPSMTYTLCARFCTGYAYLGLEYASECYCASTLPSTSTTTFSLAPDAECSMPCSGDPSTRCGAGNRLTLFKSSSISTPPINPPVRNYTYAGCYTDSVNSRLLSDSFLFDGVGMSVELCADFCSNSNSKGESGTGDAGTGTDGSGSQWFGTEYGGECYCGDVLTGGGTRVAEEECGFVCKGDSGEVCGGSGRISVYQRDA